MLYRDGFFHADLHPGNLIILPGPKIGFIDLGMVGRLDEDLRRALLYYYFALVMGDADNSARYLAAIATPGPGRQPRRLPAGGGGDRQPVEAGLELRGVLAGPADPRFAVSRAPSTGCTSRWSWC